MCVMSFARLAAQQAAAPNNQKAGELSYQLIGTPNDDGSTTVFYRFVLKMVVGCDQGAPGVLPLIIHDLTYSTTKSYGWTYDSASNRVDVTDPCVAFTYAPCFRIYYFHTDAPAEFNHGGYGVFQADCCRDGYLNLATSVNASPYEGAKLGMGWSVLDPVRPSGSYVYNGIAYYFVIPSRFTFNENSSPVFNSASDTVLYVCTNTPFTHTFSATDPDGDSLAYTFAPSKILATDNGNGSINIHTAGPPNATYHGPLYTATQPLGEGVTIDSQTGKVSGSLHDTGSYMLTVGVFEYRNGKLISTLPHTRDVVVKAFDCSKIPAPQAIVPSLLNNCNAKTVTLNNNSTPYHPELYWDNTKYLWDLGDGDTSHQRYPTHTYDTGAYNIRLITMPGYRCADTAYSKLLVYPSLHPSFIINGDGCTGQPVKFTNTSSTDIGSISGLTWKFLNLKDSTYFTSTLSNPSYNFKVPNQTYAAILNVNTTKGCAGKDTQYVNVRQSPLPLQTHDTVITTGASYKLFANSGYDTTGSSYNWSPPAGLDNPFAASPVATGTQDITYTVHINNSFGCSLTDTVHIKYYTGPQIYLPDAFTPNGDGKNDVFRPFPVGIQKLEFFRVFDRWGNTVYQTQTYLAGWDGYVNGRLAPAGTYIYEARGKDLNNKTVLKKGYVLLIR